MLLEEYHDVFSLEDSEREETDVIEVHIDTDDAPSKAQPVCRIPFAVCQEVARQLQQMQEDRVIQQSNSPWVSPIVLVKKKDSGLRICVDYHALNSVTKADHFDEKVANQIVLRAAHFFIDDAILYYVDPKVGSPGKVVVPSHLHGQIMAECHEG